MGYEYAIICKDEKYASLTHMLFEGIKEKGFHPSINYDGKSIKIESPANTGWNFLEICEATARNNGYIMPDGFRYLYCCFSGWDGLGTVKQYVDIIAETLNAHGGGCIIEEL